MTVVPKRQANLRIKKYHACPVDNAMEALEISRALDAVGASYEQDRKCLHEWPGPAALKVHFLKQLELRYSRDRDWLMQRLFELHQRASMLPIPDRLRGTH
jgi:hypothetical protein